MHDGSKLYLKKLEDEYNALDKMQALQVLHQARSRGEYATGIMYIEPDRDDFLTLLNLVDQPLAKLPENVIRPPKAVLDDIMEGLG